MKPLYSVSEASYYWFVIYFHYNINNLLILQSTYNPYLLHRCDPFKLFYLKTNDILILDSNFFIAIEEQANKTVKLITKKQACLSPKMLIKFYNTWIQLA